MEPRDDGKGSSDIAKLLEQRLFCDLFSVILMLPQLCSGFNSSGSAQSLGLKKWALNAMLHFINIKYNWALMLAVTHGSGKVWVSPKAPTSQ